MSRPNFGLKRKLKINIAIQDGRGNSWGVMKNKYIIAVTKTGSIVKPGSRVEALDTGKGFFLITKVNGRSTSPMSIFLVEGKDFQISDKTPMDTPAEAKAREEFRYQSDTFGDRDDN